MENGITIRRATQEDIPGMAALLEALFSVERDFAPDSALQRRGLALMLEAPCSRLVLVTEETGRVIGMATMQVLVSTAQGGFVGLVEDVVVDSRHRGRGIGGRLMRAVEELALEMGLSRLQLLADLDNADALEFYAGRGWGRTNLICLRKHPGRE